MRRVSLSDPALELDSGEPDGFRAAMFRFGALLGAERTSASLYELPPGQAVCPYHYEYGEEEWMVVLSGHPSVRTPQGTERLDPLDVVFFPIGPDGAHQVRNDGDAPARVLMWSTVVVPSGSAYPDSGKVSLRTGDPAEDAIVERSSVVDYYHGEPGVER
ncbi:cupin domain-containing protein [Conexibacter woesei]|uniref:Cupin 2 conserved barrel domain protein n=1 Tax=Conexibacter woesei (strain DSM 14684 / CCUG 47730 / CIP 108061 / JCM 11494 / NBRC 100937 / ID131577) TaxID=469383 RepID=D3F0I3_CONWI|nr:cupin domain-containing protein [Conexibacter woesei]ADB52043.1 Cupin 2 conserved barrel domain protein [Conexibacter woesei DSM 14684]